MPLKTGGVFFWFFGNLYCYKYSYRISFNYPEVLRKQRCSVGFETRPYHAETFSVIREQRRDSYFESVSWSNLNEYEYLLTAVPRKALVTACEQPRESCLYLS